MPTQLSVLTTVTVSLAVALPPLAMSLWMAPVVTGLMALPATAAGGLQAVALVLCGTLRPLQFQAQRYPKRHPLGGQPSEQLLPFTTCIMTASAPTSDTAAAQVQQSHVSAAATAHTCACAGGLHVAAVRPLLQAYTASAVSRWCHHLGGTAAEADRTRGAQVLRAAIGNTNALFPSVLIQLATPGLVSMVLGLLLWTATAWRGPGSATVEPGEATASWSESTEAPGSSGEAEVSASAADVAEANAHAEFLSVIDFVNPPSGLVRTAAAALGLGCMLVHTLFVSGVLCLSRLGMFR